LISQKELKGVNSPLRGFSLKLKLRSYHNKLRKLGIDLENTVILDAGCGRGFSTAIILDRFKPNKVYAFDFLPEQIELAKKMNLTAEFFVGSITEIKIPTSECDMAFIFNVLHHVPQWEKGIQEVARILKVGGYALFEEPTKKYTNFTDKLARNKHPEEAKFTREEFISQLKLNSFVVIEDMSAFFGMYLALFCRKN
jgi:ubiquinone/menaquinone biosynthesis C-methylase UbiE